MAKLTDKQKELIIADYHTNNFSQRELAKKYNVSVGTVSKLTKEVNPKNEHLVNAQMSILSAQSELSNEQMNAIMNTAQDKLRRENLIYGNAELMASKVPDIINSFIIENEDTETGEVTKKFIMGAKALRELAEANDKLSITLKVADRHAPKTEITNTNAQQNNETTEIQVTRIGS